MEKVMQVIGVIGAVAIVTVFGLGFKYQEVLAVPTDLTTGTLDAWGWIGMPLDQLGITEGIDLTSIFGFLNLNCDSAAFPFCDTVVGQHPKVTVDATTGAVDGYGWFGASETTSGTSHSLGWLNFDPAPLATAAYADPNCVALGPASYYPAEPCVAATLDSDNQEEVYGWARIESIADEGDAVLGTANQDNDWGWVLLAGTNTADSAYFTTLYRNGTFEGWAYSGGGTLPDASYSNEVGLGWIDFSAAGGGSAGGPSGGYIATERGDVYVQNNISNPAGALSPPQYNATFLILSSGGAGSVVNFDSELLGAGNFIDENADSLTLPDETSGYRSELGRIDFDKLLTTVSGSENIYGDEVFIIPAAAGAPTEFFGNGIIYNVDDGSGCCAQDHVFDRPITFVNGTALPSSGSNFDGTGLIVINGDMTIEDNLFYGQTNLLDLKNLASIVWIIRGDLTIASNVTNLVGSFFVLGDDNIGDAISDGKITTLPGANSQLEVHGLMMAREFDFQRGYEGVRGEDEPAELIYYDGRIIANTPPGLRDVASLLPIIE